MPTAVSESHSTEVGVCIFTARCFAERDFAMISRPSVYLSAGDVGGVP